MYDSLQELEETKAEVAKALKDFTTEKAKKGILNDYRKKFNSQTSFDIGKLKETEVFYDAVEEEPAERVSKPVTFNPLFSSCPVKVLNLE